MNYTKEFELEELSKGRIIRRIHEDTDEYFEVGDYHPEVGGWELKPGSRNTIDWDGILIYVRPENIKGRFELLEDED